MTDWPTQHEENGNYQGTCCVCGRSYVGPKRSVTCYPCHQKGVDRRNKMTDEQVRAAIIESVNDGDRTDSLYYSRQWMESGLTAVTCSKFFVFDVESIGLHGEGFAVGGGVYLANGSAQWEFCFCCPSEKAEGLRDDRDWVSRNVPVIQITHIDTFGLRMGFWKEWEKAKDSGAQMAAECLWPVESRFLNDCVRDDAQRLKTAPYPCHEISSVMLSAGMNPMETYDRTPSEMPPHTPLADARQSARLLSVALSRMKSQQDLIVWIASQENLFFSECSQAEEIVARCKAALPS